MKRWIFIIVLLPFFFDSMAKKREAVVVPDSVSVTLTPDSIILTDKKENLEMFYAGIVGQSEDEIKV